jgi:nucleoid DNA-binding protein
LEGTYNAIKFEGTNFNRKELNIQNYIADALTFRKKVYFPGLGTLKIVRHDADIDEGSFVPPNSKLVFSAGETLPDDEFLQNKISEGEEISKEEANQRILEYIDEIKFAFNKGEEYEIPGVCKLRMDEDNNIQLTQDPEFLPDPTEFGLESFELEGFEDEGKGDYGNDVEQDNGQKSERIEMALDGDPDMHKFEETYIRRKQAEQEQEEPVFKPPQPPETPPTYPGVGSGEKGKSNRNTIWIISGSIVVILAALILIPLKTSLFNESINFDDIFGGSDEMEVNDDFSDVEDEDFNFDEMVNEMERDIDSATRMENALAPTEGYEETIEEPSIEPVKEYVEYHIIAGSFRDLDNAQDLQKELTLLGYPSLIIEPGNGIYRVSAISFKDKVTALNELVKFRESTGLSTAWLMNLE